MEYRKTGADESRSTPFFYPSFSPIFLLINDMWPLKISMDEIKE
jgi:hypothetical protein